MTTLTEDQRHEYGDIFSLFDTKGDSKIDSTQVGDVIRALGQNPTEADIKKISNEMDPKGDKRISFEEFIPQFLAYSKRSTPGTVEDFIDGLRVFDRDGNGTISSAELRHVLSALGERLTDDEIDQLMQGGVVDQQGEVNYEEFVKLMMSG
ncbi:myosin-2 essential light chain-like isoform X2 [Amphiura filiformis]|uniref:myosin-2 essential light chain-like isoform X1 n=1 Tax=Amphiura filiformis TaxID=82378 RepID=UPI003B228262